MRFFTNDRDETTADTNDRDETRAEQAEVAAVPQQRPPSPWATAPGEQATRTGDPEGQAGADEPGATAVTEQPPPDKAQDALVDEGSFEDPKVAGSGEAARPFFGTPAEREAAEPAEPAGPAGPPGGRTEDEPPFQEPAAQPTAFGAATVGGAVAASAMAGEPAGRQRDDTDRRSDATTGVADDLDQRDRTAAAAGPVPDSAGASAPRVEDEATDSALQDGGTFEDPVVVQPGGPAQAFADTSAQPAEGRPARLFAGADADRFRSRWRDVQLRFVDDPKAATAEGADLIDEAVDALTTGIRSQKAGLAGPDGDDTEQLRTRLRSYREFLNRLLDL